MAASGLTDVACDVVLREKARNSSVMAPMRAVSSPMRPRVRFAPSESPRST